jgi:ParB family chromosome partitioning protein
MGKFNLNQLLNEKSISGAAEESERPRKQVYKTIPISVYDLVPSKDNFYSMEQIHDLKIAIELVGGVKQNLNVTPLENGKYKVLAGHRRRLASIALAEEGKPEYEFVPCSIEATEEDAELQEIRDEIMLIVTNSQRDKTDWDKIEEVKRLRAVLERYKKSAKLPGRLRDLIAEALNTSPAQIGRMEAISNNLTPEFKDELKEGRVNLSTAYELSGLPEGQQKEAFEGYKEKGMVSIKDAKAKKQEAKKSEPPSVPAQKEENKPQEEQKTHSSSLTSPETEKKPENDSDQGLHIKYDVFKVEDGSPVYNCFVLRPDKDPAARAALRAYAEATENQTLQSDIYEWLKQIEGGSGNE